MKTLIKEILLCLIAWLLAAPVILLLIPLVGSFAIYRLLLDIVVRRIHPKWEPLEPLDITNAVSIDLYKSEGKVLSNVGIALEMDADVDIEFARKEFSVLILNLRKEDGSYRYDRLHKYPIHFGGYYYWSEEKEITTSDLKHLIQERWVEKADFNDALKDWLHEGYKEECPLWNVALFKYMVDGKVRSIFAYKMSHCLGDGQTARNIAARLMDTQTDNSTIEYKTKEWVSPLEKAMLFLMGPRLFSRYASVIGFHSDYITEHPKVADANCSRTTLNLNHVKKIRRAYGCKFSDVVLSICVNSLRKFMLETINEAELPDSIYFVSSFMVPHDDTMCNQFTAMPFRIPIRNPCPEQRFEKLRHYSAAQFKSNTHKLLYCLSSVTYVVPPVLLRPPKDVKPGICCGMTLIPGFESNTAFKRYPVIHIIPLIGMQMEILGFGLATMTRGDSLDIGLLGNSALFRRCEDMERIAKYFQEELDAMLLRIEGGKQFGPQSKLLGSIHNV